MGDKRMSATIKEVAEVIDGTLAGNADLTALDITHDSRQVKEGYLFVAISGAATDGNLYIDQALEHGAIGIISEREPPAGFQRTWIRVKDARPALALAAAEIQNHPSRELKLVGITGTNGKTTTAYLVSSIADNVNEPVAMLGTVKYRIGKEYVKAERTTPEASEIQRLLRRAVDAKCNMAVMECSSHAIDLHRCDALLLSAAVFTNLTRDHLDHHGTMDQYFAVKRRLFDGTIGELPKSAIINIDDLRGKELVKTLSTTKANILSYAIDSNADVKADNIEISLHGMRFNIRTPYGDRLLSSPLVGRPNVYNTLAAVATGLTLGYTLDQIIPAMEKCTGAPGRFERVTSNNSFAVIVDYAHTDDALINVLKTAREITDGRVITVFGCGGDRDRTKRAPMGEAAANLSDVVILTSDNPRTEDPEQILMDVEVGLRKTSKHYLKIPDRREAIFHAISEAKEGDIVMIAGKGHEDYQIIGKQIIHFDDREVAREALERKR
jgi:UDP-N-acetylmuramoyl-L-alanyl-D-glutamate--2,6-diaminopimelate ligase